MRALYSAVLYTALAFGANPAAADSAIDIAALDALRTGDMVKLALDTDPAPVPDGILLDEADKEHRLSDMRGKYLLVNFWATWCAPCRKEMASLDRLQTRLGGDRFAVVTIATGPNPLPAIRKFFADEGVPALPLLRDPRQRFARDMGVIGLPISVLVDPEGREIGRLIGEAQWDGPDALALVSALIAP